MAEITRDYLDKKLNQLATKKDIKGLGVKIDKLELKIETEVAELAAMVSRRFDDMENKLDLKAEVDQLKSQMKKVYDALNIA